MVLVVTNPLSQNFINFSDISKNEKIQKTKKKERKEAYLKRKWRGMV